MRDDNTDLKDPRMTVHFDTALVDLIAMHRYVRKHTPGISPVRLLLHLFAFVVVASISAIAIWVLDFEWPQLAILLVALSFFYHIVVKTGTDDRAAVTQALQRGLLPGVLGPTAVTLEREGVVVQRLVRSERIAWSGFVGIAQTNDHLILFESDMVGVVIPRRAFDTPDEFARFADESRRLHAQDSAQSKSAAPAVSEPAPVVPAPRMLTAGEFPVFVASKPVVAIHFDASWNATARHGMRIKMAEARAVFGDQVAIAEVDCDAELELAKSIPVVNVPLVAYYRGGQIFSAVVGMHDVHANLERLMQRV